MTILSTLREARAVFGIRALIADVLAVAAALILVPLALGFLL